MMRALWSAASGMISQQTNVDTISNNISNVNTTGFKTEQAEFKSLLYQTIQTRTTTANGATKPISAQVGLGTRLASITSTFTQGSMLASESPTSFAIEGAGFFGVMAEDGTTRYTRNGNFLWGIGSNGTTLATTSGNPVLDSNGNPIVLPGNIRATEVQFMPGTGELAYLDGGKTLRSLGITIGTWQFDNRAGLEKVGGSQFKETVSSGAAMNEATTNNLTRSKVQNKFLEGSNVQVADEMVDLIVAQRAYEMNSKAIQAADDSVMIQNVLQNSFDSTMQKTATNQLENQLKKNYTSSTDDELMDVCREFESYFTEQVFKSMYKMVPETQSQDNSSKQLKEYFQDQMITEYSKKASEGEGLGIAQMMYEQMKRNKVV